MEFSRTHLISHLLLVMISSAASVTFNLPNIGPQNQNREIMTEGDGAYISDGGIQVTPDGIDSNRSLRAGRATYFRPLHLWDRESGELASFTTNFTFVIDSNRATSYADGLAFFLAQNNSEIHVGGSMGLPINGTAGVNTTTQFVAVEFDTFPNRGWDPFNSSNNPVGDHVGISISSLRSVRTQKWLSNVTGGGVCQAWIRYDSASSNLSVSFTGFQNNTVIRQDGLEYTINLRRVLPEWVIFGFSAATGTLFEKNNVRSWSFDSSELEVDKNNEPPLIPPIPNPDQGNGNNSKGNNSKIGLIVGLPVVITFLGVLVLVLWRRKKKTREVEAEETGFDIEMDNEFEMGTGPKRFTYHELARATGDFAENEKLGEGGFGGVYRELGSLVIENTKSGAIEQAKSLLTWDTRYKIAHGLASALLYLHEEWEQCVLHRDIKASNVMLDSNFNAKLGDFGLAKLVDHEKGSQTTMLAGTLGYMAPECLVTGKVSKESDVFSFGVVALEIACGRKPIEYKAQENQIQLREWVWGLYGTGNLLQAVDPRLGLDFKEEEIKHLMMVGLWCAHPDSELRPSMRQVIKVLNSEATVPILPSKMPVASYLTPSIYIWLYPWVPLGGGVFLNQSSSSISNTNSSNQTKSSTTSSCSPSVSLLHSTQGTLTKGDAFTLDLHFIRKILHQSSRFEIAIQVVRNLIASGNSNIWLVGHSLGSTMATLAGYYVHRVKMGNIGAKRVERVAAQHFIAGLFMDEIGKVLHEPIHLLPLANLTVNLKCARDLKEARGLHQWWRIDQQLESRIPPPTYTIAVICSGLLLVWQIVIF
ncbi:L-type lectin-domain containing receptor kinase IX.1-like protein [Tanacetum coccineum]